MQIALLLWVLTAANAAGAPPARPEIVTSAEVRVSRSSEALDERERAVLKAWSRGDFSKAQDLATAHVAACCRAASGEGAAAQEAAAYAEVGVEFLELLVRETTRFGDLAAALAAMASPGLPHPLAARIDLLHAEAAQHVGDRAKVAELTKKSLGFVTDWMVIGPFDNERGGGFQKEEEPEKGYKSDLVTRGKERDVKWRRLPVEAPALGRIELGQMMRPNEQAAAYLRTTIQLPHAHTTVLRMGSAEALKVWVNGKLIFSRNARRPYRPDQETVAVPMAAGQNELLVKVCTQEKAWAFSCRLTRPDGSPCADAVIDATAAPASAAPSATAPSVDAPLATSALEFWSKRAGLDSAQSAPAEKIQSPEEAKARAAAAYRAAFLLRMRHAEDEADHADRAPAKLAVELQPKDSIVSTLYALTLQQNTEVAAERESNPFRREMERAAELDPENVLACLALAEHYTSTLPIADNAKLWTMRALEAAPQNARALRLRAARLAELGLGAEEMLLLKRLAKAPESDSSAPLLAELGTSALDDTKAVEAEAYLRAALKADRLNKQAGDALERLLLSQGRVDEALAFSTERTELQPFELEAWTQKAQILRAKRLNAEADAAFVQALTLCPDAADLHARFAQIRSEEGDQEGAVRELERAVELNPKDRTSTRYLEWLRSSVKPFEDSLRVDGAEIVASGSKAIPAQTSADADEAVEVLYSQTAFKLNPDGTTQRYEHLVMRVMNEEGARRLDAYYFYHDSYEERVRVRRARVFRADGRVDDAPAPPGTGYVDFPPLSPGDVVDVEARIDAVRVGLFGNYFGSRQPFHAFGYAPTRHSEIIVVAPSDRELHFHRGNGAPEAVITKNDAEKLTTYRFTLEDLRKPKPETARPNPVEYTPSIAISTYGNWDEFSTWWWNLVEKECRTSPAIAEKVAELTKGMTAETDKIRAIYDFVVTDIRYNAWEFGIHGFKPYNAATIFDRRHGDCKDKAILIKTMLSDAGIDAYPVLIHAEDLRTKEDMSLPMVALFNHCIAYVPQKGDRPAMFLDGTARNHPMHVLPDMDRGATVLVVRDGKGALENVGYPKPEENREHLALDVELAADGSAKGSIRIAPAGRYEVQMREFLGSEKGAQKENLERFLSMRLGRVQVSDIVTSDLMDLTKPVEIKAHVEIERLAKSKGGDLAVPLHVSPRKLLANASEPQRTYDLLLGVPDMEDVEITYRLPQGLGVQAVPADDHQETDFGSIDIRTVRTGNDLRVRSTSTVTKPRITPAEYAAFRKFARDLDEAQAREITLKNDR